MNEDIVPKIRWALDSVVRMETRYRLEITDIEHRWGAKFSTPVKTGHGTHPTSGTRGIGSLSRGKAAEA